MALPLNFIGNADESRIIQTIRDERARQQFVFGDLDTHTAALEDYGVQEAVPDLG